MKTLKWFALVFTGVAVILIAQPTEQKPKERLEYVTIRWAGRDNTHIIRPNGKVEIIGPQLRQVPKPDRTDERSFYLNIAMNSLSAEGYELVTMTPDDVVMKRPR